MGCLIGSGITICGNFSKLRKKPKRVNYMKDYKYIIPLPNWFKRITKYGITCTCTEIEEHFQPYYGFDWYHSKDCALMKNNRTKCYHHIASSD